MRFTHYNFWNYFLILERVRYPLLKRFYFALFDDGHYSKNFENGLYTCIIFHIQTLHMCIKIRKKGENVFKK